MAVLPLNKEVTCHYMIQYGMVWYGMVWYGMVWYDMVWYGMVWYGMVWYGMIWYGMTEVVWYYIIQVSGQTISPTSSSRFNPSL